MFTVIFENTIAANSPLEAAKEIRNDIANGETLMFLVRNDETGEEFSVDLSEDDEDAVLPNHSTTKQAEVSTQDVLDVADRLDVELSDEEINLVLIAYPLETKNDPTGNWSQIVEHCIHNIKDF